MNLAAGLNPWLIIIGGLFLLVAGAGFGVTVGALAVPRFREALWPVGRRPEAPAMIPAALAIVIFLGVFLAVGLGARDYVRGLGVWGRLGFLGLTELVGLLAAALALLLSGARPAALLERAGLGWPGGRKLLAGAAGYVCTLWILMAVGLITLVIYKLAAGRVPPPQDSLRLMVSLESGWQKAAMLALAVLLAPAAEEALFRGVFFASLRPAVGFWPAALGSSVLFASVHMAPAQIGGLFVLGLAFCWLYNRTGSLWPGVMLHALQNAVAAAAVLLGARPPV